MRRRISPARPRFTPSGLIRISVRSVMAASLTGSRLCEDGHMITLDDFATYPDFPVAGIMFYDIAPILASPARFRAACDALTPPARAGIDIIAGASGRRQRIT